MTAAAVRTAILLAALVILYSTTAGNVLTPHRLSAMRDAVAILPADGDAAAVG